MGAFGDLLKPLQDEASFIKRCRLRYGVELVDKALARIDAGTVKETRYGWRVECAAEFDDDRSASGAEAYWPEQNRQCLCRYSKMHEGLCSHRVAVEIAQGPR